MDEGPSKRPSPSGVTSIFTSTPITVVTIGELFESSPPLGTPQELLGVSRAAYGEAFVGYVLDTDPDELASMEITEARDAALKVMGRFGKVVLEQGNEAARASVRTNIVTSIPEVFEVGLVTQLRIWCGGELPSFEVDDDVERYLLECVRDAFPSLLIRHEIDQLGSRLPDVVPARYNLRASTSLQLAILRDPALRLLFPGAPDPDTLDPNNFGDFAAIDSNVVWLSGEATGFQLPVMADAMVAFALRMAAIHGDATHYACAEFARLGLASARQLAEKKEVHLPLICGLSGINLADDVRSVDVSYGILRHTASSSRAWLGSGGPGREINTVLIGSANQQLLDIWPVNQAKVSYSLMGDLRSRLDKHGPLAQSAYQTVDRTIALVRYALLLASEGTMITPEVANIYRLNPIQPAHTSYHPHGGPIIPPTVTITAAIADRLRHWSQRVAGDHPPSLDVGMRRLLSASARADPVDGFIDAVLCWENLFGEAQDTALKVCGSLAVLLEPDDTTRRADLFANMKRLYRKRSEIVHGSPKLPDFAEQSKLRDEALDIGLRAMRATYEVDGLLSLRNSSERYLRMLLGI